MLAGDSIKLPSDMHLRCSCHVINIAVKKFLDVVNDDLVVVHKLVDFIHALQIVWWIFNVYTTQQNGLNKRQYQDQLNTAVNPALVGPPMIIHLLNPVCVTQ